MSHLSILLKYFIRKLVFLFNKFDETKTKNGFKFKSSIKPKNYRTGEEFNIFFCACFQQVKQFSSPRIKLLIE